MFVFTVFSKVSKIRKVDKKQRLQKIFVADRMFVKVVVFHIPVFFFKL